MIRYNSIDVQRTLAIFLMVVCHAGILLSSGFQQLGFYFLADNILGDFAAAMFLFLVGLSQAVSLEKRKQYSTSPWNDFKYVFYRAIILFFLSSLLSFAVSGPSRIFEWNILSIIGFSLIVIFILRHFSSKSLLFCALLVMLISPHLRDVSMFLKHWGGGFDWNDYLLQYNIKILVEPDSYFTPTFSSALSGFIWMGWFPIFPWLVFPLVGFATGKYFIQPNLRPLLPHKLLWMGVFLILIAFTIAILAPKDLDETNILKEYIAPFCFYPNTTPMLFLQLGIATVTFGILAKYVDSLSASQHIFLRYCHLISRYSLTIFVLHFLLLSWPLRVAGYFQGNIHKYIANLVLPSTAILIGIGLFIFLSIIVKFWDKYYQGKYSLEWVLGRVRSSQ